MNCCQWDNYGEPNQRQCSNVASYLVWAPTWLNAHEGPRHVCEKHFANYQSRVDKKLVLANSEAGEAWDNFKSNLILASDERYQNVLGMLRNGSYISGTNLSNLEPTDKVAVYIVDGCVWLLNRYWACLLSQGSEFPQTKEQYPFLFDTP